MNACEWAEQNWRLPDGNLRALSIHENAYAAGDKITAADAARLPHGRARARWVGDTRGMASTALVAPTAWAVAAVVFVLSYALAGRRRR